MAEPPDKLNPNSTLFLPPSNSACDDFGVSSDVNAGTMPAPAKVSQRETASASSQDTPVRLTKNQQLREELAVSIKGKKKLEDEVRDLQYQVQQLKNKELPWQNRLELKLTKRYNEVLDIFTQARDDLADVRSDPAQLDKKFADFDAARQTWAAQHTVTADNDQLSDIDPAIEDKVKHLVTLFVADSEAVKAYAAAEVRKTLADKKAVAQHKADVAERILRNREDHVERSTKPSAPSALNVKKTVAGSSLWSEKQPH
jgi:hypothetical protein